ncbi:MAG: MATE family efflux transporter, partial [Candidatus Marinimicrobia bacterium]|nr:MATE family efflux transporter [Candidatus Neomarinimicrobiota bacterium]
MWKLSIPMMLGMMVQAIYMLVDTAFIGKWVGGTALAGLGYVFPIMFIIFGLTFGLGSGVTTVIAQYIGRNEKRKADNAAEHSVLLGIILCIVVLVLGYSQGDHFISIQGAKPEVIGDALNYFHIMIGGSCFMIFSIFFRSILSGEGEAMFPMKVMAIGTVLNIILDPIFIFVLNLGVPGAAIATIISRMVAGIVVLVYLFKEKAIIRISIKYFKYQFNIVKELFKIGFPSSISQIITALSMFILLTIVTKFGVEAVAAYGIAFRLDSVAIMPVIGMMTAVMTIVGQNIGAGNLKRAYKTVFISSKIAVGYTLIIGLLLLIFSVPISRLFNRELLVISYASKYLIINAFAFMFTGVTMIIM